MIWVQSVGFFRAGELVPHVQETVVEMLLGLASGCIVGVATGIALGANPRLRRIAEPYMIALNAFPKIALAPLYLVWFGITLTMKVAMAFSVAHLQAVGPPEVCRRRLAEFIAAGVDRICLQAECPWEEFEDQLDLIRTEILERRDEIHSMAESIGA